MHGNPTELLLLAWPPIEAAPELRPLWQAQQTLHFKFRPAAADVIGDGVAAAAAAASFCCFFKKNVSERESEEFFFKQAAAAKKTYIHMKNKSFFCDELVKKQMV